MRDLKTGKCPLQAGDDLKRQSQPLARILGRSYNHGKKCFPSGNDDEVAACRALRTLYCATVNLSSLSYFDISQKPPGQKGSFIRQPQPSTETCYLQKAPSEPCTSAIRPKKERKKNRGMPHLEEESPRN
jgi:hypothetical protein